MLYENNISLIKRFISPYLAYKELDDLMQQAYFGLWEAVKHYEDSKNVRFMTFARYWIKQTVIRYIEECGSVVRIASIIYREVYNLLLRG